MWQIYYIDKDKDHVVYESANKEVVFNLFDVFAVNKTHNYKIRVK